MVLVTQICAKVLIIHCIADFGEIVSNTNYDIMDNPFTQWIDLHLNQSIPASLLLLSRTLFLPEDTETSDVLKATITNLPENIVCPIYYNCR